jgi:hypothetical protein
MQISNKAHSVTSWNEGLTETLLEHCNSNRCPQAERACPDVLFIQSTQLYHVHPATALLQQVCHAFK